MKTYFRCLSAEFLKARRTVFLLGSILLPVLLAFFNFLLHLASNLLPSGSNPSNAWMSLNHNDYTLGTLIVFPVIFVFASTFTAHQEHDNHQWRRLLSLAVPRQAIYLAKVTFTLFLGLLSTLIMWGTSIFLGGVYAWLRPESGLVFTQMPVWNMLWVYFAIFTLGMLMAGLQFEFSLRVNNFVLSVGVGIALILSGMFFTEVPGVRFIYPWSLQALIYKADTLAQLFLSMIFSVLGFAALTWWGGRAFIHRDIQD
jgi:hypothetical protein